MSKSVLIYGAGAIGRGYLAPLLQKYDYKISFVDKDEKLITELKGKKHYKAAITGSKTYEFVDVHVINSFFPNEDKNIEDYDLVFSCVGPANCYDLSEDFKRAKILISCSMWFQNTGQRAAGSRLDAPPRALPSKGKKTWNRKSTLK